ncbi:hypothetical protein PISMIDRAFT_10876 [Pisolithus microcarpus 441]|uniref:Uncharacterized protein n=1 Tax=Pisolithus microcarpus 441 TaxID=765257 RepID=A0A0C9ZCC5_9AGAM|nr:hypothetical protein PISMIDRAFT_10876 [Pisolithus microcarpus 441]
MSTSIFTDEFSDDNHPQDPDHDAAPQAGKEAPEPQEPPKPTSVTYYLALFSEAEMKKTVKQQKASNMFLQLKPDFEWDMVKAQLLMKIMQSLQLTLIDFSNYDFTWNIPRQQSSQMQLQMDNDYKFLIAHALKMKEPAVNVKIEARVAKKGKKNDSGTEHDMSDNSSNSDSDTSRDVKRVKKKSKKKSKDSKKSKETMLNKDIKEKIKLLCNRWECSKAV